jgi:biotin operon repressor
MELKEMKKDELMELVEDMECVLNWIENKIGKSKGFKKSRKDEIREIMEEGKRVFVGDIAKRLGITSRNVSSYLTYLRRDGMEIITDSKGRKFIMND